MIMKAIVVNGPGDMQLVERPMPEIKEPNQVLVKVHAAGICGSDVHVYHGSNPYAKYPVVLGHEGSGEVIAVGEGVTDLKPGASVVFEPITYCGKCYACRCGHHNVCRELKVLGCIRYPCRPQQRRWQGGADLRLRASAPYIIKR